MQIDAPAGDDSPVGHGGQYPFPELFAYVPGAHSVHASEAVPEYVPGRHKMHGIAVQPGPEYCPIEQGVHVVWPINL